MYNNCIRCIEVLKMFTEKIRILLIKRHIGIKDLAEKLKCSSSNITNKLKRDNFSEKELIEIAEVLDCSFHAHFKLNDTKEEV